MAGMVSRQCGMRNVRGGSVCERPLPSIPHSPFHTPHSIYGTTMLPDPLFPSLEAVTSANPAPTARTITVWPNAPSIRATEESLTVHDTVRPERTFPLASRRVAKKLALPPAATVSGAGETVTDATGPGLRPGSESPEESPAAASPSGRPAPCCSLQAATASAVAASAAVRTPFMRFLRECVRTGYPGLLVPRHISRRPVPRHSRSDLPFTLRIPHSTFRIAIT